MTRKNDVTDIDLHGIRAGAFLFIQMLLISAASVAMIVALYGVLR